MWWPVLNAFEIVGALAILAGVVQLLFRRPLVRTSNQAARDLGLPQELVSRSPLSFYSLSLRATLGGWNRSRCRRHCSGNAKLKVEATPNVYVT
jgi:hypothetical protein